MTTVGAEGRPGRKVHVMKIKSHLAGAVLVLGLAGGGVAITASVASANTSTPTVSTGRTVTTDAPGIGALGQAVDGAPPAGVTVVKADPAVGIGSAGQTVDGPPPAGVTVVKAEPATSAK